MSFERNGKEVMEATVQVTNLEDEADRRKGAAGCSKDRDKHIEMNRLPVET